VEHADFYHFEDNSSCWPAVEHGATEIAAATSETQSSAATAATASGVGAGFMAAEAHLAALG